MAQNKNDIKFYLKYNYSASISKEITHEIRVTYCYGIYIHNPSKHPDSIFETLGNLTTLINGSDILFLYSKAHFDNNASE